MDCGQALLTLLLLAPCDESGGSATGMAIANALAAPGRTEADREKDVITILEKANEALERLNSQMAAQIHYAFLLQ